MPPCSVPVTAIVYVGHGYGPNRALWAAITFTILSR